MFQIQRGGGGGGGWGGAHCFLLEKTPFLEDRFAGKQTGSHKSCLCESGLLNSSPILACVQECVLFTLE